MQNVANDGAGRRGHHADDSRQERRLALARGVEQPLLGEFPAPRLEQRHQRADSGELERLDHDLVGRLAGEGGQSPGRDDFEPLLGLEPHALKRGAPNDGVEPRVGVLQAKIGVAGGMAAAIAGNLAPDAHIAEPVLDRALERARQFADGDFGRIGGARVRLCHRLIMPDPAGEATRPARWPLWLWLLAKPRMKRPARLCERHALFTPRCRSLTAPAKRSGRQVARRGGD